MRARTLAAQDASTTSIERVPLVESDDPGSSSSWQRSPALSPKAKTVPSSPHTTPQPSNPILKSVLVLGSACTSLFVMSTPRVASKNQPTCVVTGSISLCVPSKKTDRVSGAGDDGAGNEYISLQIRLPV